jgi:hypothetical protein
VGFLEGVDLRSGCYSNPAGQGISNYVWQTTTNVIGMASALIASALYRNISIKVIYQNLMKDAFKGPELSTQRGNIIWAGMVPTYWAGAFVIASAIPQFSNVSDLVGAACILQFTYTFPLLLELGLGIQLHAILLADEFNPITEEAAHEDSGFKNWFRGAKKHWYYKLWLLIFLLGSAATAVLGVYSSIKAIIAAFKGVHAVPGSGCTSPLGG